MNPLQRYAFFVLACMVFSGILVAQNRAQPTEAIEPLLGLALTPAERDSLMGDLAQYQKMYEALHTLPLQNAVPMSLVFNPIPQGFVMEPRQVPHDWGLPKQVAMPARLEELAFFPVYKLAVLVRARKVTSLQLTQLYLDRIRTFADTLQCVITVLEATALAQARAADEEIKQGKYRGLLHGIPYGIKDLMAVEGTRTTWGAAPYQDQVIAGTATVVKKLEAAGAVLLCKFTLGALAMGDIWYGGVTKNPWNLKQGSSGSSAGSASGTVAGLVAFSIGTETLGSIVSPSTRCGASGIRPTFGRVSRHGAMALSWSMDKIGPICRSALDAAIVLAVIQGKDEFDPFSIAAPYNFSARTDLKKLKIGYFKALFEATYPGKANDAKALEVIRSLGVELVAVDVPMDVPVVPLRLMLTAEAAASFDELTRSNRDDALTDQRKQAWPNIFRAARFIPAVEYINASRHRYQLIQTYHTRLKDYDVILSPSFGGTQLLTTNLTGHPCVVIPNGFDDKGAPTSISFLGKLFGEGAPALLAHAYQQATEWEDLVPPAVK